MTHKLQCGSCKQVSGGDHLSGVGRPPTSSVISRTATGARGCGLGGFGGQGQLGWVETLGWGHAQVRWIAVGVRVHPV